MSYRHILHDDDSMNRLTKIIWIVFLMVVMAILPMQSFAEDDDPAQKNGDITFLDQLATNGLPALFSELAGAAADKGMENLAAGGWQGGQVAKDLATSAQIRNKVAFYNQWIGRIASGIDIAGKAGTGQWEEAAWSAGLTALGELAGTEAGKSVLASVGCATTAPVTAAILAIQIYRESAKQLTEAENSRLLESLYGGIENTLRSRGRKRGDGSDPFPVTPENQEKIWRRILTDTDFRNRFGLHVKDQLNKEWPEAGYFDTLDAYVADPIISLASGQPSPKGGYAQAAADPSQPVEASTAAERIENTIQNRLVANKGEIMTFISGIIGSLNRVAKAEEARVASWQAMQQLQTYFKNNGATIEEGLKNMDKAASMLSEVVKYADGVGPHVNKLIKEKRFSELCIAKCQISIYVRECIRWLPTKGPLGAPRNNAYSKLRAAYGVVVPGIDTVRKAMDEEAKKPKFTPPEGISNYVSPDSYYQSDWSKFVKPFDWGGNDSPDSFKEKYISYLKEGQFRCEKDPVQMPEGRKDLAGSMEKVWVSENYDLAFNGVDNVTAIPPADTKHTIKGYFEDLLDKCYQNRMKYPADLKAAIDENNEAYRILEEVKARTKFNDPERKAASDAVNAADMKKSALLQAWATAQSTANGKINEYKSLANAEHADVTAWMAEMKAAYMPRATEAYIKAAELNTRIATVKKRLFNSDAGEPVMSLFSISSRSLGDTINYNGSAIPWSDAEKMLRDGYSQSGFGKMNETLGGNLSDAVGNYLQNKSGAMMNIANEIRTNYAKLVGTAGAVCDEFTDAKEEWKSILNDAEQELDEIKIFVDPKFMDDESVKLKARAEATSGWVSARRAAMEQVTSLAEQYAGEWESDGFYLRRVGKKFSLWIEKAISEGAMEQGGSYDTVGEIRVPGGGQGTVEPWMSYKPYAHYMTPDEQSSILSRLKNDWDSAGLDKFTGEYAPWLKEIVDRYFKAFSSLKTFPEDNFFICGKEGTFMFPITAARIKKAGEIIGGMEVGKKSFNDGFSALISTIPTGLEYPGQPSKEKFREIDPICLKSPLAPGYLAIRNKFIEMLPLHRAAEAVNEANERERLKGEAKTNLPELLGQMRQRIAQCENLIKRALETNSKNKTELQKVLDELYSFHTDKLLADPYRATIEAQSLVREIDGVDSVLFKDSSTVLSKLGSLSGSLYEAENTIKSRLASADDMTADIKAFYDRFKAAYESRNESSVMALIDDKWSAGDGTTLSDLETQLRNSFTVFNEITYNISNLSATKIGADGVKYTVSYDIAIKGKIYDNNINHEEKSNVTEEVTIVGGKIKITKTLQGRFWYVQ